jgi:lipopolysaccharide/colanic/teichoic acid biosynthesis glycosyltransferase
MNPQPADGIMAIPLSEELIPITGRRPLAVGTKRLVDAVGSAVGLALLLPLFAVIALLIKFEDGGPIVYRRRVVGRKGEFNAYKFRSMCPTADARLQSNPAMLAEFTRNFKLVNDPRVTRIGTLLRSTSLDELPQLVNVLAGQMSLIGPRMITRAELVKYGESTPMLLTVRPGMTGYWQTQGRQKASYEERVRMDMHYIRNWSLLLDLKILLKTPWAVLKREGAY